MQREKMTSVEQALLEALRGALPLADRISLDDGQLLKVVRHAMMVRSEVPWGMRIPETVFRSFVLFPRVNNENPVFYHETLWEILRPRIAGKSMEEAVLEINYWCCEVATYQLTDERTANALTVLRRAFGRCGEESMLLVSALRAAGIPARQIYVPRWAHCDDNHAWVEAWVEGKWRYLGACEPEPVLDSGWFTAAASRAMLVHARVYGPEPEDERVEGHEGNAAVVNRTADYARCRVLTVRVTEGGQPKQGLTVQFALPNEAAFIPINAQQTDAQGTAALLTGYGTIALHIHDGRRYVETMVDVNDTDHCEVDFGRAVEFVREMQAFEHRPPVETRIQPSEFPEDVAQAHQRRLRRCEALRAAREATFRTDDRYYRLARGNHLELTRFLETPGYSMEDKRALLDTLREKDFADFEAETLLDALDSALLYREKYPREVWREGVLCPRVRNEMIYPVRAYFRRALDVPAEAHAVWKALEERVCICEMAPENLTPDPRAVWEHGVASRQALDVTFVAAARALGVAARLNAATGEKEYYDGGWQALIPGRAPGAKLVLTNPAGGELLYAVHFTVARLEDGEFRTLEMRGTSLTDRLELSLPAGRYRVTTCTRQIDGAIDGWLIPVELFEGKAVEVSVTMREDRTAERLIRAALPELQTHEKALPERGRSAIIAVIEPGAEPTEHLLNELIEAKEELAKRRLAIQLIVAHEAQSGNDKLQRVLREVENAELLTEPDRSALLEWRRVLRSGDLRLPFAVVADAQGRGLFAYSNYNVGTVQSLLRIVDANA